jgi:septum formation protein
MLVLASASPRRKELLAQAGYRFTVLPANICEEKLPGEDPISFVSRLAQEKAQLVFAQVDPGSSTDPLLVLGADTIVVVFEEILGKPRDEADAARMLRLLSGRVHQVITGVCLISREETEVAAETTSVTMHELSESEIAGYIATGEPMDKAGAYAIQGYAARWIPHIEGCYFNVVGLPLAKVASMIDSRGGQRLSRRLRLDPARHNEHG